MKINNSLLNDIEKLLYEVENYINENNWYALVPEKEQIDEKTMEVIKKIDEAYQRNIITKEEALKTLAELFAIVNVKVLTKDGITSRITTSDYENILNDCLTKKYQELSERYQREEITTIEFLEEFFLFENLLIAYKKENNLQRI